MSLSVRPLAVPADRDFLRPLSSFAYVAPEPEPEPRDLPVSSVLPGVVADFAERSDLRVAAFAIESGVAVHVSGTGSTSGAAIARSIVTRMATWEDGVIAIPVLGRKGPVAVLSAADETSDQRVSEQLHAMGQAVLDRMQAPTEPVRPETLTEAAEQNLAPIFGAASLAFMVVDLEGKVVYANDTVERVTGARSQDLVGRSAWDPRIFVPATPAAAVERPTTRPAPAVEAVPRAARAVAMPVAARGETSRPLRILVAEDNPVNQKVTGALIGRLGHDVTIVGDGRDVISALHAATFDLVLLDLRMPGMGGLETASEIVRQFGASRPPVFALTASATEGDRQRCLDAGMDAFVTKPITLDRLREVIGDAVATPSPSR